MNATAQVQADAGSSSPSTSCRRCGRPLRTPTSVQAGMGPVCARKSAAGDPAPEKHEITTIVGEPFPKGEDIVITRSEDGRVTVNVATTVVHHSPTGFECGYGGSGPADLALNIMAAFFPGKGVKCWKGQVNPRAWDLHQNFKRAFIEPLMLRPGEQKRIHETMIRAWVKNNRQAYP